MTPELEAAYRRIAVLESELAVYRGRDVSEVSVTETDRVVAVFGITKQGAEVLISLAKHPDILMNADRFDKVFPRPDDEFRETNHLKVVICRIRKKVPGSIDTHHGYGYRINKDWLEFNRDVFSLPKPLDVTQRLPDRHLEGFRRASLSAEHQQAS